MYCNLLLVLAAAAVEQAQLLPIPCFGCPMAGSPFQNLGCSSTGLPFPYFGGADGFGGNGKFCGGTFGQSDAIGGSFGSGQNCYNPSSRVPEGGQGLGFGGSSSGRCGNSSGGSLGQVGNFGGCSAAGQQYDLTGASSGAFGGITGMSLGRLGGMGFPGYGFGGSSTLVTSGFGGFGMLNGLGMQGIGTSIPTYYGCGNYQNSFSCSPQGQNGNANLGSTAGSDSSYGISTLGHNFPFNNPLFCGAHSQLYSPFKETSSPFGSELLASGLRSGYAKPCFVGPLCGQGSTSFYNNEQANQSCKSQYASSDLTSDNEGGSTRRSDNVSRLSRQSSCGCSKCKSSFDGRRGRRTESLYSAHCLA